MPDTLPADIFARASWRRSWSMLSCNACGRTARPGERCGEPSRPSRAAQAPCHREKADAGSASSFNFESSRSPRRRRLLPPHIGFEFQFRIKSNAPSVPPREGCLSFPGEMQNGVNASSRRFCCPKMPKSKTSFRTGASVSKARRFPASRRLAPSKPSFDFGAAAHVSISWFRTH